MNPKGELYMRANNLTLLTDLYELTMMQGYFKNPTNQTVIFDMFYRTNPCGGAFAITAGLEIRDFSFGDQGAPALDRQGAGAVYGIVFRIVKNNSVTFKSHPKGGVLNLIGINQQEIR